MKNDQTLLTLALSLCAAVCFAQPAQNPPLTAVPKPMTQPKVRIMDPAVRSNMLAKTGGLIQSSATGPAILFLNTQKRVPSAMLQETSDLIKKTFRLPCSFSDKPSAAPVADAVSALTDTNTAAVIVFGDAPGYPALLVAPENRWVLINVAALSGPNVSAETLTERTQKEIWRAFGFLMGAAHSNFESCLLKPVLEPADLDALKSKTLCPEPFGKIMAQAEKMGIKPARTITYRKAVEEGWAPVPTNDSQRAIWQELSKTPAK